MTSDNGREARLAALHSRARELDQLGQREAIFSIAEAILELDPNSEEALQFLGMWHLDHGAYQPAAGFFTRLADIDPEQPAVRLPLAVTLEETGQLDAAFEQVSIAIRARPDDYFPYLYLGSVLERMGQRRLASIAYAKAARLNVDNEALVDDPHLPSHARVRCRRGNALIGSFLRTLHADAVTRVQRSRPAARLERVAAATWRRLHRTPVFLSNPEQNPNWFYIPHLDRSAWFEREEFPWVTALEARSGDILEEVKQRYRIDDDTKPYLNHGTFSDEWQNIVGTTNWGACHFYNGFNRKDEVCSRFPVTSSVLDDLPLFRVEGKAVEALYSVLKPGTRIPPHRGSSNAKLTVHLPLVVPDNCFLRADGEARRVEFGRCLFFDDSFLHDAWNDSQDVRIVLIFQVWHPDLTQDERMVIEESYADYERWLYEDLDRLLAG